MSAGAAVIGQILPAVDARIQVLAPKCAAAVSLAIVDCNNAGLDAVVYETLRSHELATAYYARGRTVIPPHKTVTNAPDETYSWHGYGLGVDVISRSRGWDKPDEWFAAVAEHFARHGMRWGGEWKQKDLPHFQWGACKPSPSDVARALLRSGGRAAVWRAVGAIDMEIAA